MSKANNIASLLNSSGLLDSDDIATSAITAPKLNVGQLGGRRNLIINGAMQVAQRGTQETGITSSGFYTVDRFRFVTSFGTWTMEQYDATGLPGFTKSTRFTCTASSTGTGTANINFNTMLEAQDLQHLKKGTSDAESTTLSFWVKSGVTGTYCLEIYEDDNARSIGATFTIDAADTWEYKTVTFPGDTTGAIVNDNGRGFQVSWFLDTGPDNITGTHNTSWNNHVVADRISSSQVNLGAGNNSAVNYFEITGVQLEVGETATPFEYRSYAEELALCQRYYCETRASIRGVAYAVNWFENQIYWPQEMRANPTTALPNSTGSNINTLSLTTPTKYGSRFGLLVSTTGGFYALSKTVTADAEL